MSTTPDARHPRAMSVSDPYDALRWSRVCPLCHADKDAGCLTCWRCYATHGISNPGDHNRATFDIINAEADQLRRACFLTDNGRILCYQHLGTSAQLTGRDISGQPIEPITRADATAYALAYGHEPTCETCEALNHKHKEHPR
jgi:hypothetical protein